MIKIDKFWGDESDISAGKASLRTTTVLVFADTSVTSPRRLLISTIRTFIYWTKFTKKTCGFSFKTRTLCTTIRLPKRRYEKVKSWTGIEYMLSYGCV